MSGLRINNSMNIVLIFKILLGKLFRIFALTTIISVFSIPGSQAQKEILLPLYQNTPLQQHPQPAHKIPKAQYKTQKVLTIPFFDDFCDYTGYPNDTLWMDNSVFINTGYPVLPP